MSERQAYNKLILKQLEILVEMHPNLRFGQLLSICNIIRYNTKKEVNSGEWINEIIDPFYEESKVTWERMLKDKFCSS